MAVQTTVSNDLTSGVVGTMATEGPTRSQTFSILSADASNNVIGRAFTTNTLTATGVDTVGAGGTGVFAGIFINPRTQASVGTTSGTLEGTLAVPNGTVGDFAVMGEFFVSLSNSGATVGDGVFFTNATGALSSGTASTGQTQIPNCTVARVMASTTASGNYLALVRMTN